MVTEGEDFSPNVQQVWFDFQDRSTKRAFFRFSKSERYLNMPEKAKRELNDEKVTHHLVIDVECPHHQWQGFF